MSGKARILDLRGLPFKELEAAIKKFREEADGLSSTIENHTTTAGMFQDMATMLREMARFLDAQAGELDDAAKPHLDSALEELAAETAYAEGNWRPDCDCACHRDGSRCGFSACCVNAGKRLSTGCF